jgi:phage FluMu protein Com
LGKAAGTNVVVEINCSRCKIITVFRLTVESVAAPAARLVG